MCNDLIDYLCNTNNYLLWTDLRKKYEGNFDRADFDMFDKYAYFYDIPHKVMNVVIYFGLDKHDMDSSKLMKDMHDICKLLQKNQIETVREAVYLFKLYDMNHMEIIKTLDAFSKRMENLESMLQK
ncbi:hypothetical protein ACFFIS_01645 [Virgibacillus soli]|uniref:Uncharacterized protein n=1 Tax=Paracerasibacillus soli TaxID=480284 RepID=A0ABU5CUT9_9BACI|nr:hypothetical protein [Virgibacillus soli]MDY0410136.1 hypothetical protein [Virgibacillus soli]